MLKTLFRTGASLLLALSFGLCVLPAQADTGPYGNIVDGANRAIKNAMSPASPAPAASQPSSVAQVPPIQQQPVGGAAALGLPVGFTYTVDGSIARSFGDVGTFGKQWLPGGVDVVLGYGFNPTTRLVASLYQIQHYPVGFNSGSVPVYLRGFANPIGCANLDNSTTNGCTPTQINLRTKDSFYLFNLEKLVVLGNIKGHPLPLVITPTYVSRTSYIGAATSHSDIVPFATAPPDGPSFYDTKTRSAQVQALAFTLPFLKTPKMFGTFTAAPSWNVNLNGLNTVNHMQIYQILYLEYNPTNKVQLFLEPQVSRDYLPTDVYPQHLFAYFLGASYRTTKNTFVQAVLNSGGPTNEGPYGANALECENIVGMCAPVFGGLKATQLQLQFGIGSPSVLPF